MTDTIDFQVDLTSEWTAEDSLMLDAEILATHGRRTASTNPDKWMRTTISIAIRICVDRGMTTNEIVSHLKTSSKQVERVIARPPKPLVWVPSKPDPRTRLKPAVRPCTECEDPTRPSDTSADQYPNTKVRSGQGKCSSCYSRARLRRNSVQQCSECPAMTRPRYAKAEEYPNTVSRHARGRCPKCHMRQLRIKQRKALS